MIVKVKSEFLSVKKKMATNSKNTKMFKKFLLVCNDTLFRLDAWSLPVSHSLIHPYSN